MRVTGQNVKTTKTPLQILRPELVNRVKGAQELTTEFKVSKKISIRPPESHELLKSEVPGTTLNISSFVPSTPVSRFVSSKLVSRHPVMRKAECLYRVMQVSSAAETTIEVHPQRHFLKYQSTPELISPRKSSDDSTPVKILVEFVSEYRRKKHASTCRSLSATINNNGMMAGRPEMYRDLPVRSSPPIEPIPSRFGSFCPHLH